MLHNLLASYSNSSSSSSSSGDLEGTINAILISYGSLIVVVLIFLVVRAIVNFFIPFYIRSIKNSQKETTELLKKQLKLTEYRKDIENERLQVEKDLLQIEKEKLTFLRAQTQAKSQIVYVDHKED